ncbi:helix-hairpin-helix domain-containing protein [Streptococcus thoraltensis]|uniref:helix-hairpin-helix domain-containing protein n=1 Tax=Streptococcus thoraltensis TaxID=55085 RepID=UPI00037B68A9|nr:helix-hairpin-helix domain-containing protein [Streptococcus thoraltensis]MDY4761656.1 helix-hairpin-helix domain-containing protein [Streptococcus thoraltensis]
MFEDILEKIRTNKVIVGLGGLVALLFVVCLFLLVNPSKKAQEELLPSWSGQSENFRSTAMSSEKSSQEEKSQSSDMITIDVKGAVKNPGVYDLPTGSRVNDAILLAGGLKEEADRKSVNFAQKLSDEAVIYVASQGENISVITSSAAPSNATDFSEGSADKVNLNKATLADLQTISGIGQKRAQDILDYRDSNGGFKSVDDLSNVSGIGEKTLEKLREEVTVD